MIYLIYIVVNTDKPLSDIRVKVVETDNEYVNTIFNDKETQ